ncbi:hypothetical protein B0H19DRAFT_1270405 [Mycena capillaripes]|nr:hypothetical protein B0H19DRAFT_1270405 [Mycena capillaripes]
MASPAWHYVLKFFITADAAVGKSSLLVRLMDQRFLANPDPTPRVQAASSSTTPHPAALSNVRTWLADVLTPMHMRRAQCDDAPPVLPGSAGPVALASQCILCGGWEWMLAPGPHVQMQTVGALVGVRVRGGLAHVCVDVRARNPVWKHKKQPKPKQQDQYWTR